VEGLDRGWAFEERAGWLGTLSNEQKGKACFTYSLRNRNPVDDLMHLLSAWRLVSVES
jgi:hypothetical protein